ncbi:lipid A biosynthesis lauroyl acyltransferase [Helicobacter cetorum]|uniref:Lipid A biosynthesis lauroyl acyltransferase n=1 Tax=Helicobacter cetorum (strain ATCC BAA-540 / CCUG 52418 / MIT 99-5656) TaxID=1163745 RepID=I0ERB4_HELCM|nr:lipid A biosynthesis lauroyl acyltransferase [Helicobacter cetorum]AFI05483.1 lipid A biosynthesis lauroyl acyltransferase [Helicobacter cetorum MIT 99-5656]
MTFKERLVHEKILNDNDRGLKTELRIFSILIVEFLINSLGFVLARMPHSWFLKCIKTLAKLMAVFDKRRYYDAKANLDFVFKDTKSECEKEAIIQKGYENFAFIILESIRAIFIPKEKYDARFSLANEENIWKSLKSEGQAVFMCMHFGYWEAMGTSLAQYYASYSRGALGKLTKFAFINHIIISRREAFGVRFINKIGAMKELIKMYNKGDGLVGILIDQNISLKEGVVVKFFGEDATHTTIASILSRRYRVDIQPVFIDFNDDYSHYTATYYPSIRSNITKNAEADILECTQAQASLCEVVIRKHPESYFWFHRRFKNTHPEIYKKKA